MDIFVIVMGYALMGTWYVQHKRKGGVKRHHLLIGYTIFLPILLVHAIIYLSGRSRKKHQP